MAFTYRYVTQSGVFPRNGNSWASAMSLTQFYTDFASVVPGRIYLFEGGSTYTLTADIATSTDGDLADPIAIIGVANGTTNEGNNITADDFAQGSDRPFFDGGASYKIDVGNTFHIEHIRAESEVSGVITTELQGLIHNCYVKNDYGSSSIRYAVVFENSYSRLIDCEIESPNNRGLLSKAGSLILFSYFHDIENYGIFLADATFTLFSIFDTCGRAIHGDSVDNGPGVLNCIFYNCDEGLYVAGSSSGYTHISCIYSGCASAVEWAAISNCNFHWKNHMYDNTADWTNVPEEGDAEDLFSDFFVSTGDPLFNDDAGGDFSTGLGSPCRNVGLQMGLGV